MVTGIILLLCALIALYLVGPKVEIDTAIHRVVLPDDLDEYLARSEAGLDDIVPGAEKKIIWSGQVGVKTPLSVVYLHGFSACRQETAPLAEYVAKDLGANLYYDRFTGHGRSNEALASVSVNALVNDAWEAVEIGSRIGEQVVVIGHSTGGSAATWLATKSIADKVAAFVLLSPNYGLKNWKSELLVMPWGKQIAELVVGPEYGWEPYNEEYARYWTHRFPTRALLPMMGLVSLARSLDVSVVRKPVLVIYSPNDQVVSPKAVKERFERFGSPEKRLVPYHESGTPGHHVLAGDILSPGATRPMADLISDFLRP